MTRLTIAQISDTHILPDPTGKLRGLAPLPRLERVVARIAKRMANGGDVHLVVFSGDQIQDDPAAYPVFLQAIAPLRLPVAFVPGNHDHREGFASHLLPRQEETVRRLVNPPQETQARVGRTGPGSGQAVPLHRSIRLGPARVLLLDTLWDGKVQGRLGNSQLRWIDETLRTMVAGPTLVFAHHSPMLTGVDWIDPHMIVEGDELVRLLVVHGVHHFFFGHAHQPMTLERNGLVAIGAPATCFGFGGDGDAPVLLEGPPALTWIDVSGDRVRSRVEWLS